SDIEKPEGHLALYELVLQNAERRPRPIFGGRHDVNALARLLEAGAGGLESETLGDLFLRLIQGVVDLGPIRLRNDDERGHAPASIPFLGCSFRLLLAEIAKGPPVDRGASRATGRVPPRPGRSTRSPVRDRPGRPLFDRS